MERTRPHSNAWEGMHYMQDDYEMAHIMSKLEYPKSREVYAVYTTNEDKWQPTYYTNCFSSSHFLDDRPALPDMMQPTPC